MKKAKRIFAFILAVACVMVTTMNPLTSSAAGTQGASTRNVSFIGKDGKFSCEVSYGWKENDVEYVGWNVEVGQPVSEFIVNLTDPVFFDSSRKFLGWKICEWGEVTNEYGNTYYDWVQIPGTSICSTEELLKYVIPEGVGDLGFVAQWEGDDDQYYSEFRLDMYGGTMEIKEYREYLDPSTGANITEWVPGTYDSWVTQLRKDNTTIKEQTEELWDFSAEPKRSDGSGARFQGWIQVRIIKMTGSNGESMWEFERVSDTVYQTSEILAMKPSEDTVFTAKWSDIDVKEYYWNGPMRNISIQGNGGSFVHKIKGNANDEKTEGCGFNAKATLSVSKTLEKLTDPVFFDSSRKFLGWKICEWGEVTNEYGNTYYDWVQIPGTSICSTEELLKYVIPEGVDELGFIAQWEGDDAQYYSEFQLDMYGGTMEIKERQWEWDSSTGENKEVWVTNKESFWSIGLRKDNTTIKNQIEEQWDLSAKPTKTGADFEGWLQFKYVDEKDNDGNMVRKFERVSDTVYQTSDILAMQVPQDNTMFTAKWSDIDVKEYYWNGSMRTIIIQGDGGSFEYKIQGNAEDETEGCGFGAKTTLSVSKTLEKLTDPVFFDSSRKFLGWKICEWGEVTNEYGNTYYDWVQIPGTSICSTEELLKYVIPEGVGELGFIAQWEGDDAQYYSEFWLDLYHGQMDITHYEEEWDADNNQSVMKPVTESTSGWARRLRKDGSTIKSQVDDFDFSAEPTKTGATDVDFEGWIEFKIVNDGFQLVSDEIYSTDEMLNKVVPEYNVVFVSKWTDMEIQDYFAPSMENHFNANGGTMEFTYVDDKENTVSDTRETLSLNHAGRDTVSGVLEAMKYSIKSIDKQCATFDGWTVIEYEVSDYIDVPAGEVPNVGDPDSMVVFGWSYFDQDTGKDMDCWLGLFDYNEYPNKMSTEEIMKLDGRENHYFMANWKESHTDILLDAKNATCTTDGYSGNKVCSECDELLEKGHVITATGHNYKDGVCVNCNDQLVIAGTVGDTDTSKPSETVKPVVKEDAVNSVTEEVKDLVDAIASGEVTSEMKEMFSEELINEITDEIEAGNKISTEVVAKVVTEDQVEATVASEIKKNLGENGNIAQYLDLTVMIKSVSDDGTEKELGTVKELEKEITFTIVIPEDLAKEGREFFILRNHEGKVDKLVLSKNADGSYSFKTDRFSTYALAYEDVKSTTSDDDDSDTTITDGNESNTTITDGNKPNTTVTGNKVPYTGDNNNVLLYGALMIMALAAIVVSKKRIFE